MFHRPWFLIPLVLALVAVTLTTAPQAHAQSPNSHSIFRQWLTATNNGDLNGAIQYLDPNFTVTLADGSQVAGQAESQQAIMALGTPITVVSLTATHRGELDAQLQFGAGGATMSVVILGESGEIKSMTISAATSATPSPASPQPTSSQIATPLPTLTPTSAGG